MRKAWQLATILAMTATAAAADDGSVYPIVFGDSGILLGGSANGAWLPAEAVAPKLKGGERYRHYSLNAALGYGDGPPPQSHGGPCSDTMLVEMLLPVGDSVVSLAAEWNALPRAPKAQSTNQKVYRDAAAAYLKQEGLADPAVELDQVIRVDLEGDGVDEVLLAANHRAPRTDENDFGVMAGDYSFILLRRLRDGKVETLALASVVHAAPRPGDINYFYRIAAVLDLNGDGVTEIVAKTGYYEGFGAAVIEVRGLEAKPVLQAVCGA